MISDSIKEEIIGKLSPKKPYKLILFGSQAYGNTGQGWLPDGEPTSEEAKSLLEFAHLDFALILKKVDFFFICSTL